MKMINQNVVNIVCPECSGKNVIKDNTMGEFVCGSCGLVIGENIADHRAEWRAYTPAERKTKIRAGVPTNYSHFDKGLSTVFNLDKDASGRRLPNKSKNQLYRLQRWNRRSLVHTSKTRNLMQAMTHLRRISEVLNTPASVKEMGAVIYRKALKSGIVRGRTIKGVMSASLYAACRFTKNPRTLKEVSEASLISPKEVARNYRLIIKNFDMKMPIDKPMDYVTKIAEKAQVSTETEGLAIQLIKEAQEKHFTSGKDPSAVAAAALYLAGKMVNESVTQSCLAEAANVTEVTIRNRKKELSKNLKLKL